MVFMGLVIFYPKVFFEGHAIGPVNLIYNYAPWSVEHHGKVDPRGYTLSDQMDSALPNLIHLFSELKKGRVPEFIDKIQNGTPFYWVVKHESKVLLLLLLGMVFSFPVAWTLFLVLKLLLGSLFFYLFMRKIDQKHYGSLVGTLVYAFSSYAIQMFGFSMTTQYFLTPIGFFAVEKVVRRENSLLWGGVLAVVIQQLVVAGFPITGLALCILLAVYAVIRALKVFRGRSLVTSLGYFAFFGVLSAMLAAPAILASQDFFSEFDWSYRTRYWNYVVPVKYLSTLLDPFHFGNYHNGGWVRKALYIGLLPLFFSVWGAFSRTKTKRFFLIGFGISTFFVYGIFGASQLYRFIPIFNSTMPNVLLLLLPLLLAPLVVIGVNDLADRTRKFGLRDFLVVMSLLTVVIVFFASTFLSSFDFDQYFLLFRNKVHLSIVAVSVLSLVLFWKFPQSRTLRVFIPLLVFLDLFNMGSHWNRTIKRELFYPETPAISFLKENIGSQKLFLLGKSFLANTPQAFSLPTVAGRGMFSSKGKRLYQLIDPEAFKRAPTQHIFPSRPPKADRLRLDIELFDALGIRYVVADLRQTPDTISQSTGFVMAYDRDLTIWKNPEAFERAWWVPRGINQDYETFEKEVIENRFRFRETVSFSPEVDLPEFDGDGTGKVTVQSVHGTEQVYLVNSKSKGVLVVSDNFNDDWVAFSGDQKIPVFEVNGHMRGVVLEPGEQKVVFRYAPEFLVVGKWILSFGVVALGLMFLIQLGVNRGWLWSVRTDGHGL